MGIRSAIERLLGTFGSDEGEVSGESDGEGSSVWSAIPYGQWGRHAEGGGVSKAEQADSIRSVQKQAAEYENAREIQEQSSHRDRQ